MADGGARSGKLQRHLPLTGWHGEDQVLWVLFILNLVLVSAWRSWTSRSWLKTAPWSMVDEGAIREALLASQENLVVAFGAGPAALDVYFTNFEALKKQVIDASRLGLLSKETIQLAANIVGGIPAMAQSFMALEQEATRAVSKIQRNALQRPATYRCDKSGSQDRPGPPVDSDASSEDGADETDMEDQSEDSDTDEDEVCSDINEEPDEHDEDDHPMATQWHLLRDWLVDNISHPFAYTQVEHAELLKTANISFAIFQHWLTQMRENMQWNKLIENHANGDPRKWRALLRNAKDNEENLSPAIRVAISQTKARIGETYNKTIPLWWEDSVSLLAGMENAIWSGALENARWSSDASLTSDEESDAGGRRYTGILSGISIKNANIPSQPRVSLTGIKRKVLEMSTYEEAGSWKSPLYCVSQDDEQPVAKRRKQHDAATSFYPHRQSLSVVSDQSSSFSGSSRATLNSPLSLASSFTSSSRLPSVNLAENPSNLPPRPVVKASMPLRKVSPQAQIFTGTEVPPYIRSKIIPFDRKRKRKIEVEDYIISQPESDSISIPPTQFAARIAKHNIRINSKPVSSICSLPDQSNPSYQTPDQPPPQKRFRSDNSDPYHSTISGTPSRAFSPSLARKNKLDHNSQCKKPSRPTSRIRPPATGDVQPVAASPCKEDTGEDGGFNQLFRILDEIDAMDPTIARLDLNPPHQSLDSFDPLKWIPSTNIRSITEEGGFYYHLLESTTPSLSVSSPSGESPYSPGEVTTPIPTASYDQRSKVEYDAYTDTFPSAQDSEQIFDDLANHRLERTSALFPSHP